MGYDDPNQKTFGRNVQLKLSKKNDNELEEFFKKIDEKKDFIQNLITGSETIDLDKVRVIQKALGVSSVASLFH